MTLTSISDFTSKTKTYVITFEPELITITIDYFTFAFLFASALHGHHNLILAACAMRCGGDIVKLLWFCVSASPCVTSWSHERDI